MKSIIAVIILVASIGSVEAQYNPLWVFPVVPQPMIVPRPVLVAPVYVLPVQYKGTVFVPRSTYFGNRWFGPRVYNLYTPSPIGSR